MSIKQTASIIFLGIFVLLIFLTIFLSIKKISKKSVYLNFAFVLLIFLGLFFFFTTHKIEPNKRYYPPKFDGEAVVPGYFDEN